MDNGAFLPHLNFGLLLLMENILMLLLNHFLALLVDYGLMYLMFVLLLNDWLVNLMNHRFVVLMQNILFSQKVHVLVMLVNHVLVLLLDDRLVDMLLDSRLLLMFLDGLSTTDLPELGPFLVLYDNWFLLGCLDDGLFLLEFLRLDVLLTGPSTLPSARLLGSCSSGLSLELFAALGALGFLLLLNVGLAHVETNGTLINRSNLIIIFLLALDFIREQSNDKLL